MTMKRFLVMSVWALVAHAAVATPIALSQHFGARFAAPVTVPGSVDASGGTNGSHQGRLMRKLAVGGGRIAIVNSALAKGRHSRVWLVQGRLTPLRPR